MLQLKIGISQRNYLISMRLSSLLLCLLLCALLCALGVWQLQRYHFKRDLLARFTEQANERPKPFLTVMNQSDLQFQNVEVAGEFVKGLTVLIQNKVQQNHQGFEVLSGFRIPGVNKILLVDRGWLEKPNNALTPVIDPVTGQQHIVGYIKFLNEYQFILGENTTRAADGSIIQQRVDLSELSETLKQEFFPYILRMDAQQAHGFLRNWTITVGLPQRHLAYAFQWFGFAFILFIGYLCFCSKRVN